jgi:parallel beta-helix repeat protein
MPGGPAAFMSYVRFNDQHDDGQLSQFRERLCAEVRVQTGQEFAIFQDRNDIAWGQNWRQRIDEALDAVTLLLVIITPSLFYSPPCRAEVTRFLAIGTGASPVLRRNEIHENKLSGVFVHDGGLGTVEDNDIIGNALSGMEITTGGSPTVRANRINRNGHQAVRIYEGGLGVIEDNDLTATQAAYGTSRKAAGRT